MLNYARDLHILTAFKKWNVNYYSKTLPKGRMNKALSYTYNLFHRLSSYHLDGSYLIDINLFENDIHPWAVGRRDNLFCCNHNAAENAVIMYSFLGCCKASDVSPQQWLTDVLTRIPEYNNNYSLDLADLLHIIGKSPIRFIKIQQISRNSWNILE